MSFNGLTGGLAPRHRASCCCGGGGEDPDQQKESSACADIIRRILRITVSCSCDSNWLFCWNPTKAIPFCYNCSTVQNRTKKMTIFHRLMIQQHSNGIGSSSTTKASNNGFDITAFDVVNLLNNASSCYNNDSSKESTTRDGATTAAAAQPTILATSGGGGGASSSSSKDDVTKLLLSARRELDGKPLCIHRKGFVDHLKPRAFVTSVSFCLLFGWGVC